MKDRSIHTQGN